MGRIRHSSETGLRPVNQRKISKAIRRAVSLGLMPSVHRHPEILAAEARSKMQRGLRPWCSWHRLRNGRWEIWLYPPLLLEEMKDYVLYHSVCRYKIYYHSFFPPFLIRPRLLTLLGEVEVLAQVAVATRATLGSLSPHLSVSKFQAFAIHQQPLWPRWDVRELDYCCELIPAEWPLKTVKLSRLDLVVSIGADHV